MKKFCTRCGHEFQAVGREVICPSCKAAAAEDAKRAAVLKAKKASWAGESVPVRISGRASTLIRNYGAANNMTFVESLDDLLKASAFFQSSGTAWEDVTPYKSHRRDKSTAQDKQEAPQAAGKQETPQEGKTASKPQDVQAAQAAKASKTSTTAKKAASTSKAAGKGGKA